MKSTLGVTVATALVLTAVAAPIAFAVRETARLRHLHAVRPGVLYRSAQLPVAGLERAVRDFGIRTVVNLRDGATAADKAEEAYCAANGIRFVRITPLKWDGVQGNAPIDAGLKTFLDVVQDPANQPVLVHCYRGVHRTGGYVAVYRMEFEAWDLARAVREMIDLGYTQIGDHGDVRAYLHSYRPSGRYSLPR
jgi:protein tyrosine/serine phosphatase